MTPLSLLKAVWLKFSFLPHQIVWPAGKFSWLKFSFLPYQSDYKASWKVYGGFGCRALEGMAQFGEEKWNGQIEILLDSLNMISKNFFNVLETFWLNLIMFPRELFCPDPGLTAAISPSRLVGAKKFQPQAIFFFLAALSESWEGAAKNLSDLIFRSSALTNIRNWYSSTYIKLVNLFDMKSSQLT